MPLTSNGLLLRSLNSSDATLRYLSWLADPEVTRYLELRFLTFSIKNLIDFIDSINRSEDSLMLGIFLLADGSHIGNIKLGPINAHHKTAEIGLLIGDRDQWGKGYATIAIKLLSDFAFMRLGLYKLTAGCYRSNQGSHHAFLKAGYVEEGCRIAQFSIEDVREDAILLGKVNQFFRKKI